jgi:hypothetical protein
MCYLNRGVNLILSLYYKNYHISLMMIVACLLSSYFVSLNLNTNIIILIFALYILPYAIYN